LEESAVMMPARHLLSRYVVLHNEGVRTGDFSSMVELFADDAEMRFERAPLGPLVGRASIAQAFAAMPPDDELLTVGPATGTVDEARIRYGWRRSDQGGTLRLRAGRGRIVELVVG
jgi:hypothetical protein